MVSVKHRPHVQHDGVTYIYHSVCTNCWIEHGQDSRDGKWSTVGKTVELSLEIRKLLLRGMTRHAIGDHLGIGPRTLYKIVGYLLQHRLVSDKIFEELCPVAEEPIGLPEKFAQLAKLQGGSLLQQAREQYGWDDFTYYYFLASPKVQSFYVLEPHRKRRKIRREKINRDVSNRQNSMRQDLERTILDMKAKDIKITAGRVAGILGTTVNTLRKYELTSVISEAIENQKMEYYEREHTSLMGKAQVFVAQQKEKAKPILVLEVCEHLGHSHKFLKNRFPDVSKWIREQAIADAEDRRLVQVELYKTEAEIALHVLEAEGKRISNEALAKRLGTTIANLHRTYREVIEYMYSIRGGTA